MNKQLKINLNSQREIYQEGSHKNYTTRDSSSLPIASFLTKAIFFSVINPAFSFGNRLYKSYLVMHSKNQYDLQSVGIA